ncbi:unnamed protein product [Spirodela intermedia]|uniref:Rieske domain-containing protein n=1 Tax=Spirodela intermedia TaxID=51605 RepID=A0A7I8IND4_SPIIN|nr:unnamed protein product [Spirodela intermedia]CAA6659074.1 unnamed protein product [Spirodela intermedia]
MEALRVSPLLPRVPTFTRSSRLFLLHQSRPPLVSHHGRTSGKSKLNCTVPTVSPRPPDQSSFLDVETRSEFDWYAQWYPPGAGLRPRQAGAAREDRARAGRGCVVGPIGGEMAGVQGPLPHRLAPLSEGRIDQWGRLQCVYHGWCFDGNGSCKYIPQAPADGPPLHTFKKACATPYPSCEQNKILWFWPNSDPQFKDILTQKRPPYVPELDDPSYSCTMGMRDLPYGYEVLVENLMDPAHVPYAHYRIMRIPKASKNLTSSIGNLEMLKVTEEERSASLQPKKRRFLLVFICIPVSLGRSRLIWVFPRNFAVWIDRIIPRWVFHIGQNLIIDSDLNLLHLEERKIAESGISNWQRACFVPTKSDALVVAFRKWLKKYSNNQVNWGPKYWSHTVQCSSCRGRSRIASVALIAGLAVMKQSFLSAATARSGLFCVAVLCFVASRWLSHFIHKNFYYHDYSHALR